MQSWARPEVPSLADLGLGTGPLPVVHDTSAGKAEQAGPPSGEARLYVCGITPYDATHLGHAATYLAFDLLQRVWLDAGLQVAYTQNVTDVDDPLLERATATGVDWVALAERETQLFRDDMTALRILPPRDYIGVVESIDLVVELVQRLQTAGAVYPVGDDLYIDRAADPGFGRVSGYDHETMLTLFAERGGDPDRPGKRDPLDWLVWRGERPGDPAWDTPIGRGRPGWHVECAAIASHHLGAQFDVQGGGSDLIFPHHEMSTSEVQIATGHEFAQHCVHAGMVALDGHKMSKSRGNLVLVSRLRAAGEDPAAIRLALLGHHYREDWEWFDSDLAAARERLTGWRAAVARAGAAPAQPVVEAVRAALADDLDSPTALTVVDDWSAREGKDPGAAAVVAQLVDALLGVALI